MYTDKKDRKKFLIYKYVLGKSEGSGAKSYMTNIPHIQYGENICAFPHILGSPSSYMTLHPIPFEFPYTVYKEYFVFFFISVLIAIAQISSSLQDRMA
jgi:hypothetical protein